MVADPGRCNFSNEWSRPGSAGGVFAAVLAALITYVFNAHLDRQALRWAARLQFVQDQLRLLYGPLYAITRANETIYALRAGSGSFQPGAQEIE